ncbi:sulfotransferase [Blastopirellula marina]|uniref:sulfotransferase n=1 Tax=Blastopirellula marina TaxID=124 RepID=UPI001F3AC0E5|nr:sulfotransferase [Blastopirellula marina]
MVESQEAESRRLIEFCGLTWDDACLQFNQSERTVQTPSKWQVRRPVYQSSIGAWRRYEKHLGPLFEILS